MKKILITLLLILAIIPINAKALNKVNLYLFYGRECPHCEKEQKYLSELTKKYDNLQVYKYEVWHSQANAKLLDKVSKITKVSAAGVPYTIVGSEVLVGYSEGYTDRVIEEQVKYYSNNALNDKVGIYLGKVKPAEVKEDKKESGKTFKIPILGEVNAKSISLPLVTIVLGILDGFNPCAMWILLFLISMLMGMEDRKRMWILGLGFLITSALVYLMFMLSFISITKFLGGLYYIRFLIACVAIIGGIINLRSYLNHQDDGCEVVDNKKRKKIIKKVNKFTLEKNLILALVGVMALAASVNLVELACSAGFPVIFMQILSINDISGLGLLFYVFLYILFFLLDDLIVFAIAMKTLELKGVSNKYGKYSHLIGGVLMVIIGLLLIIKPEWLMFNF